MSRNETVESDLDFNRRGKLSDRQRFRMRMGIIIRGLFGLFPAGLLAITLYLMLGSPAYLANGSWWIIVGVLAFVTWLVSVPAFRQVSRLTSDLRGMGVAEDCGVLTLDVYNSVTRNGTNSTTSYIKVDNERQYLWNAQISGGFSNNDKGCVYFGRNSKLVLSIETFTEDQIEKL